MNASAPPSTPDDLFARLAVLNISTTTVSHPPAMTVHDGEAYTGHLPGVHIKNLFLRDNKEKMWLVVVPWNRAVDLKALPAKIGSGRLSFGSADRLMRVLGVAPGSVTPFTLINDKTQQVKVVLDAWMMSQDLINAHPLINTMTTTIRSNDLMAFIHACGHAPQQLDLGDIPEGN